MTSVSFAAQGGYDQETELAELLPMTNLAPHLPLLPAEFSSPFSSLFDTHSPHTPVALTN